MAAHVSMYGATVLSLSVRTWKYKADGVLTRAFSTHPLCVLLDTVVGRASEWAPPMVLTLDVQGLSSAAVIIPLLYLNCTGCIKLMCV